MSAEERVVYDSNGDMTVSWRDMNYSSLVAGALWAVLDA